MSREALARAAATVAFIVAFAAVGLGVVGYVVGYRPVVITTGSMGDAAPVGSLVIASPSAADEVTTDDVLVMQRAGAATVTHRVVAVDDAGPVRQAITKGDANPHDDPDTYPLEGVELVAAAVVPWIGFALVAVGDPRFLFAAVVVIVAALSFAVLRAVWRGTGPAPISEAAPETRPSGP